MSAQEAEVQSNQQLTPLEDYQFLGNEVTVGLKRRCLKGVRENHTITHGAYEAGVSRKCVHHWINTDPVFAEAVADAKEEATECLETSMYKRAMDRDTIAGIFLLKKYNPEFRDKVMVDVSAVQEQIDAMFAKLDDRQHQQLPAAVTEFIDTSYSESSGEYQTELRPESSDPRLEQKEEPSDPHP